MLTAKIQKIYEHCRNHGLSHVESEIDRVMYDSMDGSVNEAEVARRLQDILDMNGILSKSLRIICEKQYVKNINDIKDFRKRYRKMSSRAYESFCQVVSDSTFQVGNTRLFDSSSFRKINQGISLIEESRREMIKESLDSSSFHIEDGEYHFQEYIDFEFYFTEDYVDRNKDIIDSLKSFFLDGGEISINVYPSDTETGHVCDVVFIHKTPENWSDVEKLIKDYHETYTSIMVTEDTDDYIDDLLLSDVSPGKYIVVESPDKNIKEFDEITVVSSDETSVTVLRQKKSIKLHRDVAEKIVVMSDEDLDEIFECHSLSDIVNDDVYIAGDLKHKSYDKSSVKSFIDRINGGESYRLDNGSCLYFADDKYVLEYVDQYGNTVKDTKTYDFVVLTAFLSLDHEKDETMVDIETIGVVRYGDISLDVSGFYKSASGIIKDQDTKFDFYIDLRNVIEFVNPDLEHAYDDIIDVAVRYNVEDCLFEHSVRDKEQYEEFDKSILREEVIAKLQEIIPEQYDKFDAIIDDDAVQEFCSFSTSEWFLEQDIDNYINFVISFLEKRGFDTSMYR